MEFTRAHPLERAAHPTDAARSSPSSSLPERGGEHRALRRARAATRWSAASIPGEVVVADNASEDGSAELRRAAGARVVHEPRRGYGSAYLAGFAAARGRYIVMADADLTYDFDEIPRFVEQLDDGRRARDGRPDGQHPAGRDAVAAPLRRQPGAHRRPQRLLPHRRRATRTAACARCGATCCRGSTCARPGMEFASEMVIRAVEGEARHPRVPDRVPPARRRVASSRASATAGATCASCWSTARRTCSCSRARMLAARRADRRSSSLLADRRPSAASGTCTRWSPARC